jgi:HEAT repeat protein
MPRAVIEALIDQAYRVPEEQQRTAEVLRGGGMQAAELLLDILKGSETVGPRAFLIESLGGMPDAFQVIAPLTRSHRATEARLSAELLGRLGISEAIPLLAELIQHSDERVRLAAVDALGRYRDSSAVGPLRQALGHPSATIRARAGRALAARGSGAIAMPLLAALEAEREPTTWAELLGALAAIDAPEAAAALSRMALTRRGRFGLGVGQVRRQLAVVHALTSANTSAAKQALARIAAEGEGEVAQAAAAVLGAGSGSGG